MNELPFSPEIRPFIKPVEVGDTNKIYYDPDHPEALIRVPTDEEARFLVADPKLIQVAEKIYRRLDEMGESLDIDVAAHQFILARETSDGPVKPMLLTERIKGNHLVPIDKNNPKTLEALSRIAQLGLKYLDWIEFNKPRSVVTDIFRPEQYLAQPGEKHDKLTLIDIEPRLKGRDLGETMVDFEIGMVVGPLRDSEHDDIFCQYMRHALRSLKQKRAYSHQAVLINSIINAPEIYRQLSDNFLAGRETGISEKLISRWDNTPLIITKGLLKRFGIENI